MNITDPFLADEQRWAACQARDPQADSCFYFGVLTTGIYCRPSCAARRPRRENVRFFEDAAAARQAGLRPCRRCHPDGAGQADRHAVLIARACHQIEAAVELPDLTALARQADLSPFHFHRLFKRATGLTPRGYQHAQRAARLRMQLAGAASITQAIYDAGYGSSSRFYAEGARALGMSAQTYRRGAPGVSIRYAVRRCSLGAVLIATTPRGICALLLGDDNASLRAQLQARFPRAQLQAAGKPFAQLAARIIALVEQPELPLQLPLDLQGSAFQHRVWQALRAVPAGSTVSYGALAARLGVPRAVRAVASAVAANPVAIAVPCHRVIRSDGSLSGYRWGVARKQRLLEREARASRIAPA